MVSPAVVWPDIIEAALRSFVVARAGSAAEIAKLMSEKFEINFTRNMICGKLKRMNLTTADPNNRVGRDTKPKRHKPAKRLASPAKPATPKPIFRCDETGHRMADVVPLNLTLLEFGQNMCRWPYGNGPFVFCGHRTPDEASYCCAHQALATRPNTCRLDQ